ncbi:TetR/AcrR family transcriptional regulator [uncultured Roseibium sp.]|uniref:TetR/AcrR family transcriptional regulator n=1 Tax=uncultured Roseibium sp. TaxID=1936171 RepID=UPI002596AFEA|nr:TetR/AcrR family transcriptional regulator [uncultured Roseibium sp.]
MHADEDIMPMAERDPSPRKGSRTAARVRASALKLFARHGYAAVSMRQIASDVGVQPGALYNHFPTKQDILKDLMLSHMRDLLDAWTPFADEAGQSADPLDVFVRFHIRYHLQRREEVFISYMELRNLEPENFAEVEAERRRYESILKVILEDGQKSGAYRIADTGVAARAIIAMLTGIPNWYRENGPLSADKIEEIYLEMVRGSVAATPLTASIESD